VTLDPFGHRCQAVALDQKHFSLKFDQLLLVQLERRLGIDLILERLELYLWQHQSEQMVLAAVNEVGRGERRLRAMSGVVELARGVLARIPGESGTDAAVTERHQRNGDLVRMRHKALRPGVFEPVCAARPFAPLAPLAPFDAWKDRVGFFGAKTVLSNLEPRIANVTGVLVGVGFEFIR
jgi:hypothetical protein